MVFFKCNFLSSLGSFLYESLLTRVVSRFFGLLQMLRFTNRPLLFRVGCIKTDCQFVSLTYSNVSKTICCQGSLGGSDTSFGGGLDLVNCDFLLLKGAAEVSITSYGLFLFTDAPSAVIGETCSLLQLVKFLLSITFGALKRFSIGKNSY